MHALIFLLLHGVTAQDATTAYVNWLEPRLQANREAYLSGPHTAQRQKEALAFFDKWWTWLNSAEACGDPMSDEAGSACREQRSRTGKWPWEKYYRDPIVAAKPAMPGERPAMTSQ